MKRHIIPMLVTIVTICCSMSECENFFGCELYSPIAFELDGDIYSSDIYWHRHAVTETIQASEYAVLEEHETSFNFFLIRDCYSDNEQITIMLSVHDINNLTLGHRYETAASENIYEMRSSILTFRQNEGRIIYDSSDGYIEFDTRKDTDHGVFLSGKFEFTATEKKTGKSIEIKNGHFENMIMYRSFDNLPLYFGNMPKL